MKRLVLTLCAAGSSLLAASACTTIVVGRKASATGCVLVGHTEDFNCVRMDHGLVPARDWPDGARLPADRTCARLAQVPHTAALFWISAGSRNGVAPSCDSLLNEHGVFVTMNYGGKSRVGANEIRGGSDGEVRNRAVDGATATTGGVRDQILRCIAERATSAREGMQIATNLLARDGMVNGGWTWDIADRDEAWIVQGVNGAHFVANRVPDDEVAIVPNVLTVRTLPADTIASPGLVEEAIRRGWAKDRATFDFSRAYQGEDWFMHPHSVSRFRQVAEILTGRPWTDDVTFCVRPAARVTPETVRAILASHVVEGAAAHEDAPGPICRTETGEAMVCRLGREPRQTQMELAFGWPCLFPWVRLRPFAEPLPKALDVPDAVTRFDEQFLRRPVQPLATPNGWVRLREAVRTIATRPPEQIARWKRLKHVLEEKPLDEIVAAAEEFVRLTK